MSDTDLEAAGAGAPAYSPPPRARQRSEQDYIDLAAEIGFARPDTRQANEPERFQQWADRVEQGLSYLKRGEFEKFEGIRQEANLYAGAPEQERPAPITPGRTLPERNVPDHLGDIITRLDELRPYVADENPQLADRIERLATERIPPTSPDRDGYETEASRALQDTERVVGPVDRDPAARAELSRRATSVPGLENERLKRLLELTPELSDQKLVDRIRASADEIAKSPEQDSDKIREVVIGLAFDAAVAERRRPEPSAQEADDRPTSPEALKLVEESLGLRRNDDPRPSSARDEGPEADTAATGERGADHPETGENPNARNTTDRDSRVIARRQLAAFGPEAVPTEDREEPGQVDGNPKRASDSRVDADRQLAAFDPEPRPNTGREPGTESSPASRPDEGRTRDRNHEAAPPRTTTTGAPPSARDIEAPIGAPKSDASAAPPPRPSDSPGRVYRQASAKEAENRKNPEEKQEDRRGQLVQRTGAAAFIDFIAQRTAERKKARQAGEDKPREDYAVETGPAMPAFMKERVEQRTAKDNEKKIPTDLAKAERAGEEALKALEALESGDARRVLERIKNAAEQTQGGIEKVMEEMQAGGRYESLGKDFQRTIKKTEGLEARFREAESALAHYGRQRAHVAGLAGAHHNTQAIADKFETLDRKIGEKSWVIPSADGKSKMFDKLAESARNLFDKLGNTLRAGFGERPGASAAARPSPSF